MKHESDKRPVTLEDLLKLKRAERPAAEFWGEFDRQLRAKQLRALVEKRPWWHGLQTAFYSLGRYRLPIGAVAAVAVTFLVVRDRTSVGPAVYESSATVAVAVEAAPVLAGESLAASPSPASLERAPVARISEQAEVEVAAVGGAAAAEHVVATSTVLARDERAALSAFESFVGAGRAAEEETPSARFIASNLAAIQTSEPIASGLLAEPHGFESRGLPARAQEPLQQMTPPGESRRATRYLATMVSMNSSEPASRTTERAASRLSQEELYDQVQRFGARRGGFNVKF